MIPQIYGLHSGCIGHIRAIYKYGNYAQNEVVGLSDLKSLPSYPE